MKDFILPWCATNGEIIEGWQGFSIRFLQLNNQIEQEMTIPAWFTAAIEAYVNDKIKNQKRFDNKNEFK